MNRIPLDEMSGQKYKRTNFDDDENLSPGGTPPGVSYDPSIAFKVGATFWQRRTLLEKFLLILCLCLTLVAVILGALLGARNNKVLAPTPEAVTKAGGLVETTTTAPPPHPEKLCLTKACVSVASSILNSMDDNVDPCDDFYGYACNNWIQHHPIPSGSSRWGTFGVMWNENQIVMKNAIEKQVENNASEAELKARRYYTACMDPNNTVDSLGAQPLIDLLADLGGWNVSSRSGVWKSKDWNLQTTLENIQALGISTLFGVWVGEDEKTTDKVNIIQFDQGGLSLVRDQYINKTIDDDKILSAYLNYMVAVGELLGGEHNHTDDLMREVILFEQQIAEITTPNEERRDDEKLYHKMTLTQLQQLAPFVDWVHFCNSLLKPANLTVNETENVLVYAPEFLTKVNNLTRSMMATDAKRTVLHTYLMWRVIKPTSAYLSKPFTDAKKDFLRSLTGVTGEEEHWRYCITDTDSVLGFSLGAMFVRKAFNGNRKQKAEDMIRRIKDAFKANLGHLEWIDKETQHAAIEKADAVVDMIGFPEYILNATELDAKYKELVLSDNEYFANNIRSMAFGLLKNIRKLHQLPEKNSWSMTPATVNAYYTPVKNQIVFPAGILQAPFYDRDYPKSLNFGAMGVVMGHELTHGFDDQGREYDKRGVLQQWWNNQSVARFKERAACVADQYSQYSIKGDKVRGNDTLGENIADNGGLKAAYNAYEQWVQERGSEEPPLPGLHLNHRQLFFMAFAQVWCSTSTPEADHMSIITDSHSPPKYRVIGPLSNSPDFSKQFNCPSGSRMNPVKKCEVW